MLVKVVPIQSTGIIILEDAFWSARELFHTESDRWAKFGKHGLANKAFEKKNPHICASLCAHFFRFP